VKTLGKRALGEPARKGYLCHKMRNISPSSIHLHEREAGPNAAINTVAFRRSSSGVKPPKFWSRFGRVLWISTRKGGHRGRACQTLMDDLCELDQQSAEAKEHRGAQRATCSLVEAMSA